MGLQSTQSYTPSNRIRQAIRWPASARSDIQYRPGDGPPARPLTTAVRGPVPISCANEGFRISGIIRSLCEKPNGAPPSPSVAAGGRNRRRWRSETHTCCSLKKAYDVDEIVYEETTFRRRIRPHGYRLNTLIFYINLSLRAESIFDPAFGPAVYFDPDLALASDSGLELQPDSAFDSIPMKSHRSIELPEILSLESGHECSVDRSETTFR
ncbi:hypothetical protein EVAR_15854_1 [Eumeta japonica]|uniref:Uncharacterized protein n=1 Tax=Eumeta variegata TaxID=151549 RepID=A0A4C1UE46_EUMVA|nr:hypothetical protein EVAR_15854_1 [Eumeta japonica]